VKVIEIASIGPGPWCAMTPHQIGSRVGQGRWHAKQGSGRLKLNILCSM